MAHFSMPPARRAPRCMLPAACCATAGSGYAPDGGSIWSMAMRWSPVCCDPPSTPACVFSSMPRWYGCCRVRRACPARCCAATAGRFTSKLAPWCWPAAVSPRSPAAGAGGAPRGGGLRPFLRRTAGQSGRGDQAWRIRRRPVRHFPAPPAGLGAGVPRHSGQRPAANVSSSGGARQTRGDRRPAQRQTFLLTRPTLIMTLSPPCWRHPRGRHAAGLAAGRSSRAASLRPGPRQTVPVHSHRLGCVPAICSEEIPWRSWRSSALSTPMRWRKPLNALTTSPALAKTSIFTAGHQPITAPRVTIR